MAPTLYSYFRSSAAWRVRIALAWKSLPFDLVPVNLVQDGGAQHALEYRAINPQELVPSLVLDDGAVLTQSIAICEFLEETHPEPPLLPRGPLERARVRALVQSIACDIHPLNNLRVLQYLKRSLGHPKEETDAWYRHWIEVGFAALEIELHRAPRGAYCAGDSVSLADVCLVPQVFNARRLEVDLSPYSRIVEIDAALARLDAFVQSAPSAQPDCA